jgi:hypothetical protein
MLNGDISALPQINSSQLNSFVARCPLLADLGAGRAWGAGVELCGC